MEKNRFLFYFFAILIFGLAIRLIPIWGNNFYFTMDQANEAVKAREVWHRFLFPLIGQETSIEGVYHGSFWIIFVSLGYAVFSGHPFGSLFLQILMNVAICAYLMWQLKKYSMPLALLVGAALQVYWPFYETSRFAFNPFPLVTIAILTIVFLIKSTQKPYYYLLVGLLLGAIYNSELAPLPAFWILYAASGLYLALKGKLPISYIAYGQLIITATFIPTIISEVKTDFSQLAALKKHLTSENSIYNKQTWLLQTKQFLEFASPIYIPRFQWIGAFILLAISALFFKKNTKDKLHNFVRLFALLSLALLFTSWLWFATSSGWNPWHTVYLPPLMFIAFLLILFTFPRKFAIPIFIVIMATQIINFSQNYLHFLTPVDDASLLVNELAVVDWVYKEAEDRGFNAYSYLPSVYDYPYQYLFWWHGKKTYGYLPCEYSTFPKTPDFFVPGLENYQEPKKDCTNLRFLIVEPDKNEGLRENWLSQVRKNTELIKEMHFGNILVEKRKVTGNLF